VFRHVVEALSDDTNDLIRQTAQLARLEAQAATQSLKGLAVGLVAGLALAVGGMLVLLAALVLIGVALGLPPWASALLVATLLVAAGAAIIWVFSSQFTPQTLSLPRTRRSVRDTLSWIKEGAP
jgi:hypothetical protein